MAGRGLNDISAHSCVKLSLSVCIFFPAYNYYFAFLVSWFFIFIEKNKGSMRSFPFSQIAFVYFIVKQTYFNMKRCLPLSGCMELYNEVCENMTIVTKLVENLRSWLGHVRTLSHYTLGVWTQRGLCLIQSAFIWLKPVCLYLRKARFSFFI